MNGKMYWVLRKTIQNIVFRVKKLIYCLIDGTTGISEYKPFRKRQDYSSLYTYLLAVDGICRTAIESKEANYYVAQVDALRLAIEDSKRRYEKCDSLPEIPMKSVIVCQ